MGADPFHPFAWTFDISVTDVLSLESCPTPADRFLVGAGRGRNVSSGAGAWPNLFLVGAHKAASTSLHHYLGQHPDVFMSPTKEPKYFSRLADGETGPGDEERYLKIFADATEPVQGEASPTYLYHPDVPELIHDRAPDARILISLRDPIQRTYSNYWRMVAGGRADPDFTACAEAEVAALRALAGSDDPSEVLDAVAEAGSPDAGEDAPLRLRLVDKSLYADRVERYLDTFGRDRVHVVLVADLADDAEAVLAGIFDFLDVDPGHAAAVDTERQNTFRGAPYGGIVEAVRTSETVKAVAKRLLPPDVRDWLGNRVLLDDSSGKPPAPEEAKAVLTEVFEADVRRLEELLDRDLPELRRTWPAEGVGPRPKGS